MWRLLAAIPSWVPMLGILPWRRREQDPEHRRAGISLVQTEERYRSLVRHGSDITTVVDSDGVVRYSSPSIKDVLGYEPEDRVGRRAAELVHPDDRGRLDLALAAVLGGQDRSAPLEYRIRHADGSWRHVESIAGRLPEDFGVDGFVVNSRDVTDRKRVEQELRRSEERYRAVVEQSAEGIYLLDTETRRVVESNPALRALLGYEAGELEGKSVYELLAHPREDVDENLRVTLKEGRRVVGERKYRRKDGSVVDVEVGVNTISFGGKETVCAVVRDITKRKRDEAVLRESEERHRLQARELGLLHRVRTDLARATDLPSAFRAVVEATAEVYGYTKVSAYLLEGDALVLQHQVGYEEIIGRIALDEGVSGRVARSGRAALVEDVQQDPDFLGAVEGLTSEVCAPLCDEGRVVGTLNVESTGGVRLTRDDLRLVEALADHVGVSVGRARLYTRVRRSEERYRTLVEQIPAVTYIDRADGSDEPVYTSPHIEDMLGYTPEEWLDGRLWPERLHPDDRERVLAADERFEAGDGSFGEEYRLLAKDGRVVWVREEATLLRDEAGEPRYWQGIMLDVTGLKESERRLREAQGRYQTLVEQIPAITYVEELKENGKALTYMSPQYEAMLGYPAEEGFSHQEHWLERIHPDDTEKVQAEDDRTDETLEPFEAEYRMLAADGRVVWIRDEALVVRDEAGEPLHWQGMMFDVTEQKRSQEALLASEANLAAAQRISHLGSWQTDLQTQEMRWSEEFCRILGYDPGEVAPSQEALAAATHPEDRRLVTGAIGEAIANRRPFDFEHRVVRPDGEVRVVQAQGEAVFGGDGRPTGIVGSSLDITERKRIEEALGSSEARMRTVIEQSPLGIHIFTPEGTSLLANEAWDELWHLEEGEEPEGHNIFEDEQLQAAGLLEYVERSVAEGVELAAPPLVFDPGSVGREGRPRWLRALIYPVRDEEERLKEVVLLLEDITERVKAEEAVRESEDRFRSAFEDAPIGVALVNLENRYLRVNRALCEIFGYEEEELLRMKSFEITHPEDLEKSRDRSERMLGIEGSGTEGIEKRYVRKDGSVAWVLSVVSLLRGPDGKPSHFVCHYQDVTRRKEAERRRRESEERFRSLVQNASDVIMVVGGDGAVRYISPAVEKVLGYRPGDIIGKRAFEVVHPDDEGRVREAFAGAGDRPGYAAPVELRLRHADGSWRHVESTYADQSDDPAVGGIVVNSRDVTERKRAEDQVRRAEKRYRTLVEQVPAAIYTQRPAAATAVEYISPQIEGITGYTPEEYVADPGLRVRIVHPEDRDRVLAADERARRSGEPFREEFRTTTRDGRVIWVSDEAVLIRDDEGNPRLWQGIVADITERKALEKRLEQLAYLDPLTDLPNRAALTAVIERAMRKPEPEDGSVALLVLDLDNFRVVNDSSGYDAGDVLLIAAAERLRACLDPGDTVARLGEDEFAILLGGDADRALRVAQRIEEDLREPFPLGEGQEATVTASIGIVLAEAGRGRPEDLIRDADAAMLRAKDEGKAGYRVFDPSMDTKALQRLETAKEIRLAVERGEMVVRYEPNVLLDANGIVGMRALVCWEHPERGLLLPSAFLDVAEDTPLIHDIGGLLLREACRQAREWQARFPGDVPPMVSVGITGKQFRRKGLIEEVTTLLREGGLLSRGLNIGISEHTAMRDVDFTVERLGALKELGVQLTIENFGAGHSSLGHLSRFPVDFLEINHSFVENLREASADAAIVSGTVSLAHALGLTAAATGVGTEGQVSQLRRMGCNLARGGYFSGPLEGAAATELLATRGFPWGLRTEA